MVYLIIKSKKIYNGIYNVGYGKPIGVKKIIFMINKKINRGTPLYGKLKMRKDEVKILYPRLSKVRDTFNWSPSENLNDGINKIINFTKDKYNYSWVCSSVVERFVDIEEVTSSILVIPTKA